MQLEGTIPEKCKQLLKIANDVNRLQFRLIQFINLQKERIERNEIILMRVIFLMYLSLEFLIKIQKKNHVRSVP